MKTIHAIYLIAIGLLVGFFFACQSEEQPIPDPPVSSIPKMCDDPVIQFQPVVDTCFDLPFSIGGTIIGLQENPYRYWQADFNPVNPNELVYKFVEETPDEALPYHTELRKVNICDGVSYILEDEYMGPGLPQLDYGFNELIVTDGRDLTVVKSNGDSLMKIRDVCKGGEPTWIWEGAAILCPEKQDGVTFSTIVDKTGTTLDTLPQMEIGAYRDGKIIRASLPGVGYYIFDIYDLETKTIEVISDTWQAPLGDQITGLEWLNDEEVIFTTPSGLYTLDVNTGVITTIKETSCEIMSYTGLSASPLENGDILLSRGEFRYTSPDSIKPFMRVSLLNIYTLEEYVLELE